MSVLGPNVYKDSVKWKLNNKSKVDSVVYEPMLNTIEEQTLYTESITDVDIDVNRGVPLNEVYDYTEDFDPQIIHYMQNNATTGLSNHERAKGRIGVLIGKYEKNITLSQPVTDQNLTIDLQYTYKTDYITRGGKTMANTPAFSYLQSSGYSLANWIKNNKSGTYTGSNSPLWKYDENVIPFNPFVRVPTAYNKDINLPSSDEVFTRWYTGQYQYPSTHSGGWIAGAMLIDWDYDAVYTVSDYYNQFVSSEAKNKYFQDVEYVSIVSGLPKVSPALGIYCLGLKNSSIVPVIKYDFIDNLHIKVTIETPIRIEYLAASGGYSSAIGNPWMEIDNNAFVDYVTGIDLTIKGNTISSESTTIIYKDNSGATVTSNTKGKFDHVINKNELITVDSVWLKTNDKITEYLATIILDAYKEGKMSFECEVNADWMLDNNIQLNDYIHVLDMDNQVITKNGNIVTFKIRNIVKIYGKGKYVYNLQLLECSNDVSIVTIKYNNGQVLNIPVTSSNLSLLQILSNEQVDIENIVELTISGNLTINMNGEFDASDLQDPRDMQIEKVSLGNTGAQKISLGDDTFRDCYWLKHIDIRNVVGIGDEAFSGCINLYSVLMNPTTYFDGDYIFNDCSVMELWFEGTATQYSAFDFGHSLLDADIVYVLDDNGNWTPLVMRSATYTITNGTYTQHPAIVYEGATVTCKFNASNNYTAPDTVTVTGQCDYTYAKNTRTITITNIKSNISIDVKCVAMVTVDNMSSTNISVYDGADNTGTLLGVVEAGIMTTFNITGQNMYIESENNFTLDSYSSTVLPLDGGDKWIKFSVSGSGLVDITN